MHAKYRHALPQLGDALFLTDGGMETTLIFHRRPRAAAFRLVRAAADRGGRAALARYYAPYVEVAQARRARAGARHADLAGEPGLGGAARLTPEALDAANAEAVALVRRDPRRRGDRGDADRGERRRRAARRRLRARTA